MELFKSPDHAAMFALRYSSQQYPQSPMAKNMQRLGMAALGQGKGLSGLDGAAQAGLIRARIERLTSIERACVIATFSARIEDCPCCGADKPLDEYKEAIATLVDWASQHISAHQTVRKVLSAIVQDFFERRRSIGKIADQIGIPRRTAYDQKSKVWPHLSDLNKRAQSAMGDMLIDLCEPDAE